MRVWKLPNEILLKYENYLTKSGVYIWKEYISDADVPGGKIMIDCRVVTLKGRGLPYFLLRYATETKEDPLVFVK